MGYVTRILVKGAEPSLSHGDQLILWGRDRDYQTLKSNPIYIV